MENGMNFFKKFFPFILTLLSNFSLKKFDRLYDLHLSVMQSDSSDTTRPVSVNVLTPEEIDGNINPTITYGKVILQ